MHFQDNTIYAELFVCNWQLYRKFSTNLFVSFNYYQNINFSIELELSTGEYISVE